MGVSPTPPLQSGLCANGLVTVTAQDEPSEVEPKAAVQTLQTPGPPQKARIQKQLPAHQEQHSHGE